MKKDMMMSAEEQEFWEGYEAWLDEQADRSAYERTVEM